MNLTETLIENFTLVRQEIPRIIPHGGFKEKIDSWGKVLNNLKGPILGGMAFGIAFHLLFPDHYNLNNLHDWILMVSGGVVVGAAVQLILTEHGVGPGGGYDYD